MKLFRSSSSNLDGGAASVITSSIFEENMLCYVGVSTINKQRMCVSLCSRSVNLRWSEGQDEFDEFHKASYIWFDTTINLWFKYVFFFNLYK